MATHHVLLEQLNKNWCSSNKQRFVHQPHKSLSLLWDEHNSRSGQKRSHSNSTQDNLTHMRLGEHDRPQRLDSREADLCHDLCQAAGIPSHICHMQGRAGLHHHRQHPHHQAHKLQVTRLGCQCIMGFTMQAKLTLSTF